MSIEILGLHLSPRKNGNSEVLLDHFMKGAEEAGAKTKKFSITDLNIKGCIECGYCEKHGKCSLSDDMDLVNPYLEKSSFIVVSSSIFFYDIPAQGKALIDRAQVFWSRKYLLKTVPTLKPNSKGFLIGVGASKGEDLFLPTTLTIKYFFDSLSLPKQFDTKFYRHLEAKGDAEKDSKVLREVYEAGLAFARSEPGNNAQGC